MIYCRRSRSLADWLVELTPVTHASFKRRDFAEKKCYGSFGWMALRRA